MNLINFELQQRGLEINDKEMKYILYTSLAIYLMSITVLAVEAYTVL